MPNLGEEICGEYLKYIRNCEFVTYNVTNPDIQGEIDVIGVNLKEKEIYVCEVAVHVSGLQYTNPKTRKKDDYNRFTAKLAKDIAYAKKYFKDYSARPMIWSPIVRISGRNAKYNPTAELEKVSATIRNSYKLELELIINEKFLQAINELKVYAAKETSEFKSNVMRMLQIEQKLVKHVQRLEKLKST